MGKVIFFNLIYMRGEKSRPNDGYESVNLSPAEKAGLKPEEVVDLDVVLLKKKKAKKEVFAQGTDPDLKTAASPEDDFSDEPTKVFKRESSADTKAALQMVKDISTPTGEALAEVRDLIGSHNAPEVVARRKADKEETKQAKTIHELVVQDYVDEGEEVNDLEKIRKEIAHGRREGVKKLDEEIKAGFKNEDKQSVGRPKAKAVKENLGATREIKGESEKVKNAKAFAENAIRTYSKLYIEYDPKAMSNLHEGAKDAVAALDLTAITPPPFKAIFSSKGRQLRDVYGKVQEAIRKYNNEVEAS